MRDVRAELSAYLLESQPLTLDRGRLAAVEQELTRVVDSEIHGPVVELGCFKGGMTAMMRATLDALGDKDRVIHTYDAFEGIPAAGPHDGDHLKDGDFSASVEDVKRLHRRWGLRLPQVHAGWFDVTLPSQLPEGIAFAYLDADRYSSTLAALRAAIPLMSPGGVILLDDYADAAASRISETAVAQPLVPGVMRACVEFFGLPLPLDIVSVGCDWGLGLYRAPISSPASGATG
ncbi:TylF/MycF/NovP-related O-methyltransferase [Streptomyces sp. NPDC127051]|uniref:TylF/MycF/NovP-related O-methyltransferase n=1 Tax=Streptomyces sp. NPDC127051 TaxID=3347119 RepID=UPI003664C177